MRRALVVANWKMNGTETEATALVDSLLPLLVPSPSAVATHPRRGPLAERTREGPEIAIAPPFTSLRTAGERLRGSGIALAAQNLHAASHGAFTGEISGRMLAALGVRYVVVGHSERRRLFRETDEDVGRKAAAAAAAGLIPILCVGEEERDRLDGRTLDVIERQLTAGIGRLDPLEGSSLVVAYEPVWAIGTGRNATTGQLAEAHDVLRRALRRSAEGRSEEIRILYGGSVTPENATEILASPGVDGALVGGASLSAASFAAIVSAVPA